jgi:hypothetical protein
MNAKKIEPMSNSYPTNNTSNFQQYELSVMPNNQNLPPSYPIASQTYTPSQNAVPYPQINPFYPTGQNQYYPSQYYHQPYAVVVPLN